MKHISIMVPLGQTSISNIESTKQLFSHANALLKRQGRPAMFEIQLVGLALFASQQNKQFTIRPDVLIGDVITTDLIIIPATIGDPTQVVEINKAFIPWILKHRDTGAEVACYCVGAFFLAATGLLDGKKCATHWYSANLFRVLYPRVCLLDDKIITEDAGIYTSGGAFSYLNLLIHLIERYAGREIAIHLAKSYVIDIDRYSQSPFIIFEGQKKHDDGTVKSVQNYIETYFKNKISVEQLATTFAIGRRTLERRFKLATSNTIAEYVQRVKIEAAKKEFEMNAKSLSEVMFNVGYNDIKGFRTIFKRLTGLSPAAYKAKYHKLL
jgi:transcriptional regulator GlxA family with amidase domain